MIVFTGDEVIGDGGDGSATAEEDVDLRRGDVFVDDGDGNDARPLQSVHPRQVLL